MSSLDVARWYNDPASTVVNLLDGSLARPADQFEVRVLPAREAVWVKPVGELDLATCPELRAQVEELLAVGFDREEFAPHVPINVSVPSLTRTH